MSFYKQRYECIWSKERAILFKLGNGSVKKENWYYRIRKKDGTYVQKSTRTTSRDRAEDIAQDVWLEILKAEDDGLEYANRAFCYLFERYLRAKAFKEHRYARINAVYTKYFGPFFNKTDVKTISNDQWIEYLRYRVHYYDGKSEAEVRRYGGVRNPAKTTIGSERRILIQFLRWCERERIIARAPLLDYEFGGHQDIDERINDKRRASKAIGDGHWTSISNKLYNWAFFNRIELAKGRNIEPWDITFDESFEWLRTNSSRLREKVKDGDWRSFSINKNKMFARLRLYYFLRISYGTLIRPNASLCRIRWKHIRIRQSVKYPEFHSSIIHVPLTKKGKSRQAIGSFKSTEHILRWKKISKDFGYGDDEDYVFPNWSNTEPMNASYMGRTWSILLKGWKLNKDVYGRTVTVYAFCRHQRISNAIKKSGWDLITLSRASDTSLMSISSSYAEDIMEANSDRYANTFKGHPKQSHEERDNVRMLLDELGYNTT